MKIISKIYISLFLLVILTACGSGSSVSAPPVDLPAPITGRIIISDPDASGNVTITGSAGAVDGGSMVMAVNEEIAGTVAVKILDSLVRSAYADSTFPPICSETGHSCAVAESDGSFVIILSAELGNSIVIGVIDPDTGDFISDLLRRIVGEYVDTETCLGDSLSGTTVDVKVDPVTGDSVLLQQGDDEGTNKLIIGGTTPVSVSISGCYAHSLAIRENLTGMSDVIVTSMDDRVIWKGVLDGTTVSSYDSYSIDDYPMHIAFVGSDADPVMAIKTSDSVALANVSFEDGSVSNVTDLIQYMNDQAVAITGLTNSLSLDILTMHEVGNTYKNLGLLLTNDGTYSNSYITLFRADSLQVLNSLGDSTLVQIGISEPTDAKLFVDSSTSVIKTSVLDSGENRIVSCILTNKPDYGFFYWTDNLSSIDGSLVNMVYDAFGDFSLYDDDENIIPVNKIGFSDKYPAEPRYIVGATSDGRIWSADAPTTGVNQHVYATQTLSEGGEFVALDMDNGLELLFVADQTTGEALNGSSLLW